MPYGSFKPACSLGMYPTDTGGRRPRSRKRDLAICKDFYSAGLLIILLVDLAYSTEF